MSLTNFPNGISSFGLPVLDIVGAGNVYYVCQAANTNAYALATLRFAGQKYDDGTAMLHTTIQSALDATVENRNDYVIVMPDSSDYDLTAALTMSKARVHLICPAGIGWQGVAPNMARIHQTTATTENIVVTADTVEIAGLFFKGYDGTAHDAPAIIRLSGTRWCAHIHDCFFGVGATAAGTGYGLLADGACSHFSIHDNYFTNYAPGLITGTNNTLTAFIGITSASSTRGVISNNIVHTGSNTTATSGISCVAVYGIVKDNLIIQDVASGAGADAGVLTNAITLGASTMAFRNLIGGAVSATDSLVGGTADASATENFISLNGGTLVYIDS